MKKKDIVLQVILILGLCFVANYLILQLLPKMVAFGLLKMGHPITSTNLVAKYGMGIGVRLLGSAAFLFIIYRFHYQKYFTMKFQWSTLWMSWMFFVYIVLNVEIQAKSQWNVGLIVLMILEAMVVGMYEEIVFRGFILTHLLKRFEGRRKGMSRAVIAGSVIFGCSHFFNLLGGAGLLPVLMQVIYTTIIGVALSAIFIRSRGNLVWCAILHGLYDVAAGFSDFEIKKQAVSSAQSFQLETILPYLWGICLFIPLLVYGIILLKKATPFFSQELEVVESDNIS